MCFDWRQKRERKNGKYSNDNENENNVNIIINNKIPSKIQTPDQLPSPAEPKPAQKANPKIISKIASVASLQQPGMTKSTITDLPSTTVKTIRLAQNSLVPIEDSSQFMWKDYRSKLEKSLNKMRDQNKNKKDHKLTSKNDSTGTPTGTLAGNTSTHRKTKSQERVKSAKSFRSVKQIIKQTQTLIDQAAQLQSIQKLLAQAEKYDTKKETKYLVARKADIDKSRMRVVKSVRKVSAPSMDQLKCMLQTIKTLASSINEESQLKSI